jgi:hypothetical protein
MDQTLPLLQHSTFENILVQINDILVAEETNQEAQAELLSLNPADFSWQNRMEDFLIIETETELEIPIVNVWFNNSSFETINNGTNINCVGTYYIDVYSEALTPEDYSQIGLTASSSINNRVVRQIIGILMSPKYYKLGFPLGKDVDGNLYPNFIKKRYIEDITKFIPENSPSTTNNTISTRVIFKVEFVELINDLNGDALTSVLSNLNTETSSENLDGVLVNTG